MARKTDSLHSTPLFVAVQAVFTNANASDHTADAGNRADLDGEAARLCRRAADELDSRT